MQKKLLIFLLSLLAVVLFTASVVLVSAAAETDEKEWSGGTEPTAVECEQYQTITMPTFTIPNPSQKVDHYVIVIANMYDYRTNEVHSYYTWTEEEDPGTIEILVMQAGTYTMQFAACPNAGSNGNRFAATSVSLTVKSAEKESEYWDHWEEDDWSHAANLAAAVGMLTPGEDPQTFMTYLTGSGEKGYGAGQENSRFTAAWSKMPLSLADGKNVSFQMRVASMSDGYASNPDYRSLRLMFASAGEDNLIGIEDFLPSKGEQDGIAFGWNAQWAEQPGISVAFSQRLAADNPGIEELYTLLRSKPYSQSASWSDEIDTRSLTESDILSAEQVRNATDEGGAQGTVYMPDYVQGDALNFAHKYNSGEWFDVCLEYSMADVGDVYLLTLDQWTLQIPVGKMAGAFDTFYLGFGVLNFAGSGSSAKIEIRNLKNDSAVPNRVERLEVPAALEGVAKGDSVSFEVSMIPADAEDLLDDVTLQFESMNSNLFSVNSEGVVTIIGDAGQGYIKVSTSTGKSAYIFISLLDTEAPVITLNEYDLPSEITEGDILQLPNFVTEDNVGVTKRAVEIYTDDYVSLLNDEEIEEGLEYIEYIVATSGIHKVVYIAEDASGNRVTEEISFTATEYGDTGDWIKYEPTIASAGALTVDDSGAMNYRGNVGFTQPFQGVKNYWEWSSVYYDKPLTFTQTENGYTSISFDLNVAWNDGDLRDASLGSEDYNRIFRIMLYEADVDGTIRGDKFDNADGWKRPGMQIFFGRVYGSSTVRYNLCSGLTGGTLSSQHVTAIDTYSTDPAVREEFTRTRNGQYGQGETYMPDFVWGSALDVGQKLNTGDTIHVTIGYYEEDGKYYYSLTLDDWTFRIPAEQLGASGGETGFGRAAYLGFQFYSLNGRYSYDLSVSNVQNGTVDRIEFAEGKELRLGYGAESTVTPSAIGYDGQKLNTTFTFHSSDESIVTIGADGRICAVGAGRAIITVYSALENKYASIVVITDLPDLKLQNTEFILRRGESAQIVIESAAGKVPCVYSSSDPFTVAVLRDGTIQAIKTGTATITVSYFGKEMTCTVQVLDEDVSPETSGGCQGSITGIGLAGAAALIAGTSVVLCLRKKYY